MSAELAKVYFTNGLRLSQMSGPPNAFDSAQVRREWTPPIAHFLNPLHFILLCSRGLDRNSRNRSTHHRLASFMLPSHFSSTLNMLYPLLLFLIGWLSINRYVGGKRKQKV
ncbi:hypothetical protein J3459_007756 [Metarhizium acridum]|uniref:uncharacterized protein n=1 Tax=Metarhizium acridum TaxID=92637 RepID=UPI001C6C99C4|nr:hypothetical protein J3458_019056 [Metarhizium acridum]KAG8426842.1 hypothetical protein J3459_007756 [Metarhizium acridum]